MNTISTDNRMLVLVLATFSLHSVALAQVDTGTISGTVKDQTGAVIQSAVVKVENRDTGIAASFATNAAGLYLAPDLRAGIYQVSASAAGFETITKKGIELRVQDRIPVDFELPIGQASTVVAVEAQAPVLQTETSSLGQVVEDRQIENLPLTAAITFSWPSWAPALLPLTTPQSVTPSTPTACARCKTAICWMVSTTKTRLSDSTARLRSPSNR